MSNDQRNEMVAPSNPPSNTAPQTGQAFPFLQLWKTVADQYGIHLIIGAFYLCGLLGMKLSDIWRYFSEAPPELRLFWAFISVATILLIFILLAQIFTWARRAVSALNGKYVTALILIAILVSAAFAMPAAVRNQTSSDVKASLYHANGVITDKVTGDKTVTFLSFIAWMEFRNTGKPVEVRLVEAWLDSPTERFSGILSVMLDNDPAPPELKRIQADSIHKRLANAIPQGEIETGMIYVNFPGIVEGSPAFNDFQSNQEIKKKYTLSVRYKDTYGKGGVVTFDFFNKFTADRPGIPQVPADTLQK